MNKGVDVFYIDTHHNQTTVHSEHVPFEELFLRKLVDATMVRNQLWIHEQHENNNHKQSAIYVTRWTADELDQYGDAVERVLFEKYDVSPYYEIQWYVWREQQFFLLFQEPAEHALYAGSVMLDHGHVIADIHYLVKYAVLDLDRRKLLVFVTME